MLSAFCPHPSPLTASGAREVIFDDRPGFGLDWGFIDRYCYPQ
jgi:hypothetical protein